MRIKAWIFVLWISFSQEITLLDFASILPRISTDYVCTIFFYQLMNWIKIRYKKSKLIITSKDNISNTIWISARFHSCRPQSVRLNRQLAMTLKALHNQWLPWVQALRLGCIITTTHHSFSNSNSSNNNNRKLLF